MNREFNLFDEVSVPHLLAWMDSLASREQRNLAEPFVPDEQTDPFSRRITYLKKELSRYAAENGRLYEELEQRRQAETWFEPLLAQARENMADASERENDVYALVTQLHEILLWLVRRFWLSANFPLFMGRNIFAEMAYGRNPVHLAWELYLAAINCGSMAEIFDRCNKMETLIGKLPEKIRPFFDIGPRLTAWFRMVTQCLDKLNGVETGSLEAIGDLDAIRPNSGLQGLDTFMGSLNMCRNRQQDLFQAIRDRHKLYEYLFAIANTSLPTPDYRREINDFKARGAFATFKSNID